MAPGLCALDPGPPPSGARRARWPAASRASQRALVHLVAAAAGAGSASHSPAHGRRMELRTDLGVAGVGARGTAMGDSGATRRATGGRARGRAPALVIRPVCG
jgi:hypothetical protein